MTIKQFLRGDTVRMCIVRDQRMNPVAGEVYDQERSEDAKNELWINSITKIRITEINGRKMLKRVKASRMERP
jgi:hypothetical protein